MRGHGIKNIVFMKKKFLHAQPKCKFCTLQRILQMILAENFWSLLHSGDSLTQSLGNLLSFRIHYFLHDFSKKKMLQKILNFILDWSIIDLQCWVSFRCTAKWFSYTYTYIHSSSDSFPIQIITWSRPDKDKYYIILLICGV